MMQAVLEWARGPLFVFCLAFMLLGLVRHVVITLWEMRRTMRRAGDKSLPYKQALTATAKWLLPAGKLLHQPAFSLTSVVFHVGILVVPVFLAGHIALWERGIGLSWYAIPNSFADVLTLAALVAALGLVLLRLVNRTRRGLSRGSDYLMPLIAAFPFATGFLVMHPALNPLSFDAMMLAHVLSAELVMILIPLTRLSHTVLLPSLQLISEMGWRWPSNSAANVEQALGKQGEPI